MSVKKIAFAVCCIALLTAGTAQAVKLKIKNLPADIYPAVDAGGALDFGTTFVGLTKLTVNLNNGKATVSGKAVVTNATFARQTFIDEDIAGLGTLVHDRYVVSANGRATYSGRYEDVVFP
jgi:hypothetical protein